MSDQARRASQAQMTSPSPGSSRPPAVVKRPSNIPAERIPEPELQLTVTPDVQASLDRIQESLDNVSVSLQAILRSFEGFTGGLVRLTGETETLRELAHGAASRSSEEHTPDEGAFGTPDRARHTTEPGGASRTEALRSTDER